MTAKEKECCGIYAFVNRRNGKMYVGQSDNVYRRRKQHLSALRSGKHPNNLLQLEWNLYGARSFSWKIIELCPPSELNGREKYWIDKLGTLSPNGYNQGWEPYHREPEKRTAIRKKLEYNKKKRNRKSASVKKKNAKDRKDLLSNQIDRFKVKR